MISLWKMVDKETAVFLNDIIIFQAYRGKGYGRKTMQLFEKKARELGCNKIQLHVFAHNDLAVSLYKKLNYKITNMCLEKDIIHG